MALRLLLILLCGLVGRVALAQGGRPMLKPVRTERPPILDGRLDDPAWTQASTVTDFETFIPEFGKRQPEKTVAYMAYDAQNLYFAFRCLDDQADKIKASLSRRDDLFNDDFVCVNLDTFDDQQSLTNFYVNPLGVQGDSRFANNREDFSIDLVWYSAGRLDALGYTVEIHIPLKTIRYRHGARVTMSVFFERSISRRQEHASFPAMDARAGYAFLTQMAPMEYLSLERPLILELLPAYTYSRQSLRANGGPLESAGKHHWGLTAKYGLTPSLILDATLNPDFSQVEADAGQVDANLRFNLFYPEKRPFFLEGSEVFTLGAIGDSPLQAVLHTRTILDPSTGLKLTGKIGQKDTLAVLQARDEAPAPEATQAQAPDPLFTILRYKRTAREDGYLGLFYAERGQGVRENQVMGTDGQIRLTRSDLLSFHALGSRTRVGEDGFKGHALGLEYQRDTSSLNLSAALHKLSDHFEADAGYLTRTDLASGSLRVSPKFYPENPLIRRIDPLVAFSRLLDGPSGLSEGVATLGVTAIMKGNASVTVRWEDASEVFLGRKFATDAVTFSARNQWTKQLTLSTSYRTGKAIRYVEEPFQGKGSQASLAMIYQPSENLNLNLGWTHADFYRESTGEMIYNYSIYRGRLTYQPNAYFFVRGIVEYNAFRRQLLTDFLASYTYIPGTVVHVGYGSLYKKQAWEDGQYNPADQFLEMQRGLFFKASYLWRM